MRLFIAPNTIAVAAAIALNEAGLDYELQPVDFAQAEQTKASYHAVNPKGRVPALATNGGNLTETGAILEYIAAQSPTADLIPADPWNAAKMREVLFYLASTMHVNHAHKMRGSRWATQTASFDDMAAKVPNTMTASAVYVEETSLRGPFVMGEHLTLADPYLFIICCWLEGDGVDLSGFPKIRDFLSTMNARPSVQSVRDAGMLTL